MGSILRHLHRRSKQAFPGEVIRPASLLDLNYQGKPMIQMAIRLNYNQNFHQEAAAFSSKQWAKSDPNLFALCFTMPAKITGSWCRVCQSLDRAPPPPPKKKKYLQQPQQGEMVQVSKKDHECRNCHGDYPTFKCSMKSTPNPCNALGKSRPEEP